MGLRIAVAQISSESNHFVTGLAGLDFFRTTGYLLEGPELLGLNRTDTEVGGFLSVLQSEEQVEVVPLVAARANSGNPLSAECYHSLKQRLLEGLQRDRPVQGILLSCHGSMGVQDLDDPEGDLAGALREIVGPRVPLALTLDLHGNLTRSMVHAADILLAYHTYPHRDAFQTGQRAARLLLQAARGRSRPAMALARLPLILTSFNASTEGDGPFAKLRRQADRMEQTRPEVLSASVFNVGAYIDVPEMGCSSLVITEDDEALAGQLARRLALRHWGERESYRVEPLTVADAVERGRRIQGGPILLLDTADTTGGGAAGDSIALVRSLIELRVSEPCLAMVVDPQAVADCRHREPGSRFQVEVGHRLDPQWGKPLAVEAVLRRKSEGRFRYRGGILGGTEVSMGPSVVLQTGSLQLLVVSRPTYEWADEQYRSMGLDPRRAKFVCVKNMMNFRVGYGGIMKAVFVVAVPGPTPADMGMLPFRRIRRPVYPLDAMPETVEPEMTLRSYPGA
jgi:microcystin degradation protein MlrC